MTNFEPKMKLFISIALALAIFIQPLSKVLIVADYALNKKTITAKYCENKTKPKMHCNGKCHLRKLLIKHDKQSGQEKSNSGEKGAFQFYDLTAANLLSPTITQHFLINSRYTPEVSGAHSYSLIKPPAYLI